MDLHQRIFLSVACLTVSLFSSSATVAQDSELSLYVRASRLAVRESPSSAAKINRYLPTNHPVWIKSRSDDWCEVVGKGDTNQEIRYGYVACQYLAESKIRLEEIERQYSNSGLTTQTKLSLFQQKFWVSPSPESFYAYALTLDESYPRPDTNEEPPKRPLRPEFEAMKQFMRSGWIPEKYEYPPYDTKLEPARPATFSLPPVTRSLFGERTPQLILAPYIRGGEDPIGRATVVMSDAHGFISEALSRGSIKSIRMSSMVGPLAGHYGGFLAMWDVGGLAFQFSPAIPVVAITATEKTFKNAIARASTEEVQFDAECDQIGETLTLVKPVSESDSANGIFTFIAAPESIGVVTIKRLMAKTRKLTEKAAVVAHRFITGHDFDPNTGDSLAGYHAFIATFDLNDDGIADIAFEGIEGGPQSNTLSTGPKIDRVFAAYLNLNGVWMKHSSFSALRCAT